MRAFFVFDGEGIVCERVYFDPATILAQLGLTPGAAAAASTAPPASDG